MPLIFFQKAEKDCSHVLEAKSRTVPPALQGSTKAAGALWPSAAICIFIRSLINVSGPKDTTLLHLMTPARRSLLGTVPHYVTALLSPALLQGGDASVKLPFLLLVDHLWGRPTSSAAGPASQSHSKHGAVPPDLSSFSLNLCACAALI